MAPIKFENNLKEKLEQRELQPSANSWNTLQERLDANEKKKNNKGFWWFAIAASFVGILIITSVFFDRDEIEIIEPTLVNTQDQQESKTDIIIETSISNNIEIVLEKPEIEKKNVITKKPIQEKVAETKIRMQQKQKALNKEKTKGAIAQIEIEKTNNIQESNNKPTENLSFEDIKLQEVIAQVQALNKANNRVSDAEINKLLDQAQKEIALHRLYNETTKKVDANALLQDVEEDLEQSFRDRAFKAIRSGYDYVKTAVVERNN